MSKKRFSTDRQVATLKPIAGQKRTDFYHSSESGFICRVSDRSKAWMVAHTVKVGGRSKRRKVTIGLYPNISLADALAQAQKIKADGRTQGTDIVGARNDLKKAPIIKEVMDHYFQETPMVEKTLAESKRISQKDIIPTLGNLKAIDLLRQDVKDLHRKITERGSAIMANRTVELLRRAFNCAFEEEFIAINPFPNLKKIKAAESVRDRILKDSEIKTIWKALDYETGNMRDIMRLLLLLGQRSMETMSMSVADIDIDRKEWTVPAARTKNGKPNVIPLPETAWSIIKPRMNNETWIFPSKYNTTRKGAKGDGHTKSTKDVRIRIKKATGIDGWTSHDCRRTCRTIMSREGILPHIAEQVLGHVQGGVEGIYDQHAYLKEKLIALEKVDRAINKILGTHKANKAEIIELQRAV